MIKILTRRASMLDSDELKTIADAGIPVIMRRTHAKPGDFIVLRYPELHYSELCADLHELGATMLTSSRDHNYCASVMDWYPDLHSITPRTWFQLSDVPHDIPVVLKGSTNSRKDKWSTHMFAPTYADRIDVYSRLMDDTYIGRQDIVVREYVPLRQFGVGLHGLPITNEWRYFILDKKVVTKGFYWAEHYDDLNASDLVQPPQEFVERAIGYIGLNSDTDVRFYVLDFAQKADGSWIVMEINDAQQSGNSMCPVDPLYKALASLKS